VPIGRRRILPVLVVIGIAALSRIGLAGRQGLWADEIFSLAMATGHSLEHPAAEAVPELGDFVEPAEAQPATAFRRYLSHQPGTFLMPRVIRAVLLSDTSPPLYYVTLAWWTELFGTSDRALHLFSTLWALACFPWLWYLGRRTGGRRAGLTACILFAAAPVGLYYSLEGRMYSLLWFLAVLTGALSVKLHDRGSKPGLLLLWILVGAAGFLTHYFFAFVWAACAVWLWFSPGRSARRWLLGAILLTALLVLPWYLHVPESLARWRITGHWLDGRLTLRQTLTAPAYLGWSLLSGRGVWGGIKRVDRLGELVLLILGLLAFFRARRWLFSGPRQLLWLWVLAACTGPVVFDLLRGTFTALITRYALAGVPAAMLLLGVTLSRLPTAVQVVGGTLFLSSWIPGLAIISRSTSRGWEPYREVAAAVGAQTAPGDLLLVHSIPSGVIGIARYYDGAAPIAAWVGQLGRRRVPDDVENLVQGRRRVALIRIHEVGDAAAQEAWLRQHATLLSEQQLQNAHMAYFAPRDAATFEAGTADTSR
jgi:uncharacterized membrane protein